MLCRAKIIVNPDEHAEYRYNVQLWESHDDGKTYVYAGRGKFCKTSKEAARFAAAAESEETDA